MNLAEKESVSTKISLALAKTLRSNLCSIRESSLIASQCLKIMGEVESIAEFNAKLQRASPSLIPKPMLHAILRETSKS